MFINILNKLNSVIHNSTDKLFMGGSNDNDNVSEQTGNVNEPEQTDNDNVPEQTENVNEPEQTENVNEPEQTDNVNGQTHEEIVKEILENDEYMSNNMMPSEDTLSTNEGQQTEETLPLLAHQDYVKKYFMKSNSRGVLLYHKMGSGKTILVIALAELYDEYVKIVVVPASLRKNFKYNIYKYYNISQSLSDKDLPKDFKEKLDKYVIVSYEEFKNKLDKIRNKGSKFIVILDEAHRLRNTNKTTEQVESFINPENVMVTDGNANAKKCSVKMNKAESKCYPYKVLNKRAIIEDGINKENLLEILDKKNILHYLGYDKEELGEIIKHENDDNSDKDCISELMDLKKTCGYIRKDAHKVFLLTGTPMMGHPSDISRLINTINGNKILPTNSSNFEKMFIKSKKIDYLNGNHIVKLKNTKLFIQKIKEFISYHKPDDRNNYPSREDIFEKIIMSEEQLDLYTKTITNNFSMGQLHLFQNNEDMDKQTGGGETVEEQIIQGNNKFTSNLNKNKIEELANNSQETVNNEEYNVNNTEEGAEEQSTEEQNNANNEEPTEEFTEGQNNVNNEEPTEEFTEGQNNVTNEEPTEEETEGQNNVTNEEPTEEETEGQNNVTNEEPTEEETEGQNNVNNEEPTEEPTEEETEGQNNVNNEELTEEFTGKQNDVNNEEPTEEETEGQNNVNNEEPTEEESNEEPTEEETEGQNNVNNEEESEGLTEEESTGEQNNTEEEESTGEPEEKPVNHETIIKKLTKNKKTPLAVMNSLRQISNTYESNLNTPKIQKILKNIMDNAKPVLVYSNFLENGLLAIVQGLKENDLKTGLYTGSISENKKNELIDKYNNGEIDVLCISSSGGEGIDLKNTRQVHIIEPDWNINKTEQAISRAFRYKSHIDLPESDRNIKVFRYISVFPDNDKYLEYSASSIHRKERANKAISMEEKIQGIADVKMELVKEFDKLIINNSIETDNEDFKLSLQNDIDDINGVLEELVYLKKQYDIKIIKESDPDKKKNLKQDAEKVNNEYINYSTKLSKLTVLLSNINIREQVLNN